MGTPEAVPRQPGPAAAERVRLGTEYHLQWRTTAVAGRPACYGTAGEGPALVFLHGWGLAQHAYKRALKHLVAHGLRVYAPGLPGFGGTADLPASELSLGGYSRWLGEFLDAARITGQVTLIGHSFGGGVAIRAAYDFPDRVARLIVVNSIGGSAWSKDRGVLRSMRERPLWDWGLHLQADLWPVRQFTRVIPVIAEDAIPNLLRNPWAILRVANLARSADLTVELAELKRRRLPVTVLWGQRDTVIPQASSEALRAALGNPACISVPGNHVWLLADPSGFAEIITGIAGLTTARSQVRAGRRRPCPSAGSPPPARQLRRTR
jgi:pimeloyl-ACP methyl ester carboxylesterase